MPIPVRGKYPSDWKEIAKRIKKRNNFHCERCGIKDSHNPNNGNMLTIHHMDGDKSNCADWNLMCLCQRCHLHMQHINIYQGWLFPKSFPEWFKPHLEGWRNAKRKELKH